MEMDWTTDDPQHPPNTTPGCQYQPSQPSSIPTNSAAQAHDRHYDPVHDTLTNLSNPWHQYSGVNSQSRPSFPSQNPQSSFSQWGTPGFTPSWHRFGDIQPGAQAQGQGQGQDPSNHRAQPGSTSTMQQASWDFRSHNLSYGFGSTYAGPAAQLNGRGSAEPSVRLSIQIPSAGADSTQLSFPSNPTHTSTIQQQPSFAQDLSSRGSRISTTPLNPTQQPTDITAAPGTSTRNVPMPPGSLTELRNAQSRVARANRMSTWIDPPRRRGHHPWDSDSDDDLDADLDAHRDLYFGPGAAADDERMIAAYRGHLVSGKKVPTKEAIASLEAVNLEGLKDDTCSICYNKMGVSNPEGVTETPLRLPKCQHIFGDKCIKKWFEDSDSCPYCRDTLPSEVPNRRTIALESMRAAQMFQRERERMTVLASQGHRNRHALPSRYSFPEDTGRSVPSDQHRLQEYELMLSRTSAGVFNNPPPSRSSPADSPESRRRQARGRVGSNRAPHTPGRPTSVGSARPINPTAGHSSASQRVQVLGNAGNHGTGNAARRSTPSLSRQGSGGATNTNTTQTTPSRNRFSASSEEASPPVVDGSNENNGERSRLQQLHDAQRRLAWSLGDQWDDHPSGNRRSPSPSDSAISATSHDSRVANFEGHSGQSGHPYRARNYSSAQPTSYADFQNRLESRYGTRDELHSNMNGNSQPRWSH